jgi:hypothetical protein
MIQGQKFPIHQEIRVIKDEGEKTVEEFRTRSGYLPQECFKSLETSLLESGTVATGRSLHFASDLVCSGGLSVFIQLLWHFAIRHVGIASPRVFVYLRRRINELQDMMKKYADDDLIAMPDFQTRITELVFVLRDCPRRGRIVPPKVGQETHRDGYLQSVASAPETMVVRKVFRPGADMAPLLKVGCEFVKAISDGAIEKALFWVQWTLDEDSRYKKIHSSSLTGVDRGLTGAKGKAKHDVLFYFVDLCAESYKDYASRQMIRMNEEFQCILDLIRSNDPNIGARYRKDLLFLCIQILCEVPRWKVPAAPSLIKDPVVMTRAIQQSPNFFNEVLSNPKVSLYGKSKQLFKSGKVSETTKHKITNSDKMVQQFDAMEMAMNAYLNQ